MKPVSMQYIGWAFNVTHFDLPIVLVWVVGGVSENGGWVQ